MPNFEEHKIKTLENTAFGNAIEKHTDRFATWEIIACFYSMVHALEQLFAATYIKSQPSPLRSHEQHSATYSFYYKAPGKGMSPHYARKMIIAKWLKWKTLTLTNIIIE